MIKSDQQEQDTLEHWQKEPDDPQQDENPARDQSQNSFGIGRSRQ